LWDDGRIGAFRGIRDGRRASGVTIFCQKGVHIMEQPRGNIYRGLVEEIIAFFRTGKPPVPPEETIQIFAFMDAADKSKKLGGKPVSIAAPR
jgi:hypothetical protein